MIALLVVLAVLWLAYVIIDSMGPVGIMLVLGGIVMAFLTMGCATPIEWAKPAACPMPPQCQAGRIDGKIMCTGSLAGVAAYKACLHGGVR